MLRRKGERKVFFQTLRRHQIGKKRGNTGKLLMESKCIENLCDMFVGSVRLSGKEQHSQQRNQDLALHTAGASQKTLISDESLLKMLIFNLQPLEMTEHFVNFVKVLSPTSTPPPTPVIHSQLRQLYNKTKEELQAALSSARHIALTCELWTARDEDRYLTVGCHFVDSHDNLRSCILQTSRYYLNRYALLMYEDDIQNELSAIMDTWDIKEKVCAVVMAGMEDVRSRSVDTKWDRMQCFAEALNDACEKSMLYREQLTLQKCMDIIMFFQTDSEAMRKLREIQSQLGKEKLELFLSSGKQWFLVLPMLQSLSQQYHIMLMVLDERGKTNLILDADDKDNIQKIMAALQPVSEAVSTMKKDHLQTVSFVLPMMRHIVGNLEVQEKTNDVAQILLIYARAFLLKTDLASATYLDPRLKTLLQSNDRKSARDTIIAQLSGQPFCLDDKYKVLLDRYEAYNPPEEIKNPVTWWRHTGKQEFKELSNLAQKNLITVSTVVPLQMAFSCAAQRVPALRGSISPADLNMMLFLNGNCVAPC